VECVAFLIYLHLGGKSSVSTGKKSLKKLKKVVEAHMKKELDIMEMTLNLDKNEIEEFHRWYISHPYSKGIRELQDFVRTRTN
jgi:hypothetical protein